MQTTVELEVRYMIYRDISEVLSIERTSFPVPWSEGDFYRHLKNRCAGLVAEQCGRVVGYVIYEPKKACIYVLNFAVALDYQRRGIGRWIITDLIARLSDQGRQRIVADVSEWNTEAHLFFKSMGFRAMRVVRGLFDGDVSGYRFIYEVEEPVVNERNKR